MQGFQQGFQQGFHCVILDFKDIMSAELCFKEYRLTIVFENYCLDFSGDTDTLGNFDCFTLCSQQLDLFSTFSSMREEIHEQVVNLDTLLSFTVETCSRYPSYPSQGTQAMLTQDKETKKV